VTDIATLHLVKQINQMNSPEKIQAGSTAPDFTLASYSQANGQENTTLSQLQGKVVLLAFYPKDDTPGCTKEMCSFRDDFAEFTEKGIIPLGISKDKITSHEKFATKYNLSSLILLSDENGEVSKMYNIGSGYSKRTLFLIDRQGKIAQIIEGMPNNQKLLKAAEEL